MLGFWQAPLDSDDQRALGDDAGMVRMLSLNYDGTCGPLLTVQRELKDESG